MTDTVIPSAQHLNDLVRGKAFAQLKAGFSQFCPFEATGMVRAEIRHSNFLAYIIKPNRPHGFGTALLKSFLESTLCSEAREHLSEGVLSSAEIRREWQNIDLLIILPATKTVVAVELKIDASQSPHQLLKYRSTVEARWPRTEGWRHQFVFLTKHAETPNDRTWHPCRLSVLVEQLEQTSRNETFNAAPALDTLKAYVAMMKKHHLGTPDLENLARALWSEHEEALNFLMERRPDPFTEIFVQLRDSGPDFLASIAPAGAEIIEDKHAKRILRYAFKSWDSLPHFCTADGWTNTRRLILVEIKMLDKGLEVFLMRGPRDVKDQTFNALTKISGSGRFGIMSEDVLFTSDDEISFDLLTHRLRSFLKRAYNAINPELQVIFSATLPVEPTLHPA